MCIIVIMMMEMNKKLCDDNNEEQGDDEHNPDNWDVVRDISHCRPVLVTFEEFKDREEVNF